MRILPQKKGWRSLCMVIVGIILGHSLICDICNHGISLIICVMLLIELRKSL